MSDSFYSLDELHQIGFKAIGSNVKLSKFARIYGASNIQIGDNVRIDDFCLLSGHIKIGNYVHIAAYCALFAGTSGIFIDDFAGVSSRSVIYAESDDYSGTALTNPTVPMEFRKINGGRVNLSRHVLIGTGTTILPGINIGEGASVGAMSLVSKDILPWSINVGIPCKKVKERSRDLLEKEKCLNELYE